MKNQYRCFIAALCIAGVGAAADAAVVNEERTIDVGGQQRKYVLYVPDGVGANAPVVFSLHGAGGHDTDRSPMRTDVADQNRFIVVYPQGADQYFPIFGGSVPGWNASGVPNEDLDFFKAVIDAVGKEYSIDKNKIYSCGFSNGGMMTYSNASAASDVFAAFASISGFPLNEFHHRATSVRPVPFMHIHGKQDDFVKYSCMPIIRDAMVAHNGCDLNPTVDEVAGKYRKSVYEAGDGGFPYVYYEIDGMGHNDFTWNTEDGNSAVTMWKFLSQYSLNDKCDRSLWWKVNVDEPGFEPEQHSWKVSADRTRFEFGRQRKPGNADNNVYPSVQLNAGDYKLCFNTTGSKVYVKLEPVSGGTPIFCKSAVVGSEAVVPFSVPEYSVCKITIAKTSADDTFTGFAIYLTDKPAEAVNCQDDEFPAEVVPEGQLIEIPQDQGVGLDDFGRTACAKYDGYTQYTATDNLQIAFKMLNVDVKDCDYVVIKFAEPVAAGWHLAFWSGYDLVDVPEGSTEYVYDLDPDVIASGVLPQICLMTFFGGFQSPLTAKVTGVYKHSLTASAPDVAADVNEAVAVYDINGVKMNNARRGLNIVKMQDGSVHKIYVY